MRRLWVPAVLAVTMLVVSTVAVALDPVTLQPDAESRKEDLEETAPNFELANLYPGDCTITKKNSRCCEFPSDDCCKDCSPVLEPAAHDDRQVVAEPKPQEPVEKRTIFKDAIRSPSTPVRALVIRAYEARLEGELSIAKGTHVLVVPSQDKVMWEAKNAGKIGLVSAACLALETTLALPWIEIMRSHQKLPRDFTDKYFAELSPSGSPSGILRLQEFMLFFQHSGLSDDSLEKMWATAQAFSKSATESTVDIAGYRAAFERAQNKILTIILDNSNDANANANATANSTATNTTASESSSEQSQNLQANSDSAPSLDTFVVKDGSQSGGIQPAAAAEASRTPAQQWIHDLLSAVNQQPPADSPVTPP